MSDFDVVTGPSIPVPAPPPSAKEAPPADEPAIDARPVAPERVS
jgi:hypothetical protein